MGRNLLRRVRWGNVALAVAACATLGFGLAWSISATTSATLPADEPRPLVAEEPIPTPVAPGEIVGKERAARKKRAGGGDERRRGEKDGGEKDGGEKRGGENGGGEKRRANGGDENGGDEKRARGRTPTRIATTAPPVVAPAPRRSAPPTPGGGGEFGFEGG